MKIFLLLALLLLPNGLRADDKPAGAPVLSALTNKAWGEFQAGQKAAACADATAALAQNSLDRTALGISKLTCGDKPIDKLDFKKKAEKPEGPPKDNLKPKPLSGKPNGPQEQQQQSLQAQQDSGLETGALPAENNPSQVISGAPSGPGLQDQPTTYDKLMQAQSLLAQGKPAEAAEAARSAIDLQPRNRRAFDAWAEATRQLRNYDQVLSIAELGLKTFPNDLDLLKNKIFALNKKKDYAAAIALADQALSLYATDATLLALKAYALGRNGDKAGMVKALETAFALDPSFEPLLMDARASTDGEPFLMPGDVKEGPKKGIGAKPEGAPMAGLLIFGGLIVLLLITALLLVTGAFKRGAEEPAPDPGPSQPAPPPASPPAP